MDKSKPQFNYKPDMVNSQGTKFWKLNDMYPLLKYVQQETYIFYTENEEDWSYILITRESPDVDFIQLMETQDLSHIDEVMVEASRMLEVRDEGVYQ